VIVLAQSTLRQYFHPRLRMDGNVVRARMSGSGRMICTTFRFGLPFPPYMVSCLFALSDIKGVLSAVGTLAFGLGVLPPVCISTRAVIQFLRDAIKKSLHICSQKNSAL